MPESAKSPQSAGQAESRKGVAQRTPTSLPLTARVIPGRISTRECHRNETECSGPEVFRAFDHLHFPFTTDSIPPQTVGSPPGDPKPETIRALLKNLPGDIEKASIHASNHICVGGNDLYRVFDKKIAMNLKALGVAAEIRTHEHGQQMKLERADKGATTIDLSALGLKDLTIADQATFTVRFTDKKIEVSQVKGVELRASRFLPAVNVNAVSICQDGNISVETSKGNYSTKHLPEMGAMLRRMQLGIEGLRTERLWDAKRTTVKAFGEKFEKLLDSEGLAEFRRLELSTMRGIDAY